MLETSLGLHRKLGNEVEVALTLSTLSHARLEVGDAAGAEASEREALAMFRSLGHAEGEAIGLLHLGQFAVYVGDAAAAQAHLEGALRIAKDIDYHEVAGEAELRLAENAFDSGRLDDARQHLERSLAICTEAGDRHGAARATGWFGRIHLAAGDLASARKHLCDAAQTLLEFEMREELIECLEVQAELAGQLGQAELAARLAGAAQAYRSRLDLARSPKAAGRWERRLASLRQTLGPMTFDAAWNAGLALDFRAAIRQANTTLEMAAAT